MCSAIFDEQGSIRSNYEWLASSFDVRKQFRKFHQNPDLNHSEPQAVTSPGLVLLIS